MRAPIASRSAIQERLELEYTMSPAQHFASDVESGSGLRIECCMRQTVPRYIGGIHLGIGFIKGIHHRNV